MYSENDLQKSDHSDKLDQKENNKLCSFLTAKGLLVSSYLHHYKVQFINNSN
jgi:hypothetical protein